MALKGFWSRNRQAIKTIKRVTDQTANFQISIPAYSRVVGFYVAERNALAITGGIRVGSAAAGTQFLTAGAVAASSANFFPATSVPLLSATAQILYVEAVTAWNGAKIDIKAVIEVCNPSD